MFDIHLRLFCLLVGGFLWDFFCLKISANFLMACNLVSPMDENGAVGAGLDIAYIKYSAALVVAY